MFGLSSGIDKVFKLRELGRSLILGNVFAGDIPSDDLLALRKRKLTVGFGCMGPAYHPEFEVIGMCSSELDKRRTEKIERKNDEH